MKESLIQTAIEQYLQLLENQKKIVYIKNNSGATKIGNRFIRYGKAGSSDFLIFCSGGKSIHMEVKNEKGRQNENQKGYQENIENLGHYYCVVKSVDEAEEILAKIA